MYHRAGIREYWLVDPRQGLDFKIYRTSAKKYAAVRPQRGWLRSEVFDRSFRLTAEVNDLELREFNLEVR